MTQAISCPGSIPLPIGPNLFSAPDARGRIHLLASQCRDCNERMFPARMRCVSCYGPNLETVSLDRTGKVESYTVIRQAPPGYGGDVPYVLGIVLLGNKVRVLSHLVGKPVDGWAAGDEVSSCVLPLPVASSQENLTLSYAFRDIALDR
jgi:uncharacterized OB-fold protein